MPQRRTALTLLGPALALAAYALLRGPADQPHPTATTGALAAWMVAWWVGGAVSLYATALLPLVVLPLAGVTPVRAVAAPYGHPIIFLALGGFVLAAALERWGLHARLSAAVLARTGGRPRRTVAAVMAAAALLSMWISNTAATLLLLPVAVALLGDAPDRRYATALLLGVCYACSVGGMTTLVGTTTNSFFAGFAAEQLGEPIAFATWTAYTLPLALAFLPVAWWVLTRGLPDAAPAGTRASPAENPRVPWSTGARRTAVLFALIAGAWTCAPLLRAVPGLGGVDTYTVGAFAALVFFVVPAGGAAAGPLLEWRATSRGLPWGVLILVGGGLALAGAISTHGLSDYLGARLVGLAALPPALVLLACVTAMVFLTEITTNVASVTALAPVFMALATGIGLPPKLLLYPVTVAASFAFMLPVATPPNAVVFASGRLAAGDMARTGLTLNLLAIALVTAWGYALFTG